MMIYLWPIHVGFIFFLNEMHVQMVIPMFPSNNIYQQQCLDNFQEQIYPKYFPAYMRFKVKLFQHRRIQ